MKPPPPISTLFPYTTLFRSVTGFVSLKLLFALLTRVGLRVFAFYCWFAGLATLLYRGFLA